MGEVMSIFSIFNMAQAANQKAEVTMRSGGHDAIIITWRWNGQYLNRSYCKARMTGHRLGEYEAWRIAFNAVAQIMGVVECGK